MDLSVGVSQQLQLSASLAASQADPFDHEDSAGGRSAQLVVQAEPAVPDADDAGRVCRRGRQGHRVGRIERLVDFGGPSRLVALDERSEKGLTVFQMLQFAKWPIVALEPSCAVSIKKCMTKTDAEPN